MLGPGHSSWGVEKRALGLPSPNGSEGFQCQQVLCSLLGVGRSHSGRIKARRKGGGSRDTERPRKARLWQLELHIKECIKKMEITDCANLFGDESLMGT